MRPSAPPTAAAVRWSVRHTRRAPVTCVAVVLPRVSKEVTLSSHLADVHRLAVMRAEILVLIATRVQGRGAQDILAPVGRKEVHDPVQCCRCLSGGSWLGLGWAPKLLADDRALVLKLRERWKRHARPPLEGFSAAGERRDEARLLEDVEETVGDLGLRLSLLELGEEQQQHGDYAGEQQAIHNQVRAANHAAKVLACVGRRYECVDLIPIAFDL